LGDLLHGLLGGVGIVPKSRGSGAAFERADTRAYSGEVKDDPSDRCIVFAAAPTLLESLPAQNHILSEMPVYQRLANAAQYMRCAIVRVLV
jgi:hypothetical protein